LLLSALGCSFGQQALFFFPFGERARLIGGLAAIAAQPGESGSHGGFQKSARPTLLQGGPNAARSDPTIKRAGASDGAPRELRGREEIVPWARLKKNAGAMVQARATYRLGRVALHS